MQNGRTPSSPTTSDRSSGDAATRAPTRAGDDPRTRPTTTRVWLYEIDAERAAALVAA